MYNSQAQTVKAEISCVITVCDGAPSCLLVFSTSPNTQATNLTTSGHHFAHKTIRHKVQSLCKKMLLFVLFSLRKVKQDSSVTDKTEAVSKTGLDKAAGLVCCFVAMD